MGPFPLNKLVTITNYSFFMFIHYIPKYNLPLSFYWNKKKWETIQIYIINCLFFNPIIVSNSIEHG
jgi:hypothetical protein